MSLFRSRLNTCLTAIVILALLSQPFDVLAVSDPARAPSPAPSRARQPEPKNIAYTITASERDLPSRTLTPHAGDGPTEWLPLPPCDVSGCGPDTDAYPMEVVSTWKGDCAVGEWSNLSGILGQEDESAMILHAGGCNEWQGDLGGFIVDFGKVFTDSGLSHSLVWNVYVSFMSVDTVYYKTSLDGETWTNGWYLYHGSPVPAGWMTYGRNAATFALPPDDEDVPPFRYVKVEIEGCHVGLQETQTYYFGALRVSGGGTPVEEGLNEHPDQIHSDSCPVPNGSQATNQTEKPINTLTGNYTYQRTDLLIPTVGDPLHVERTYIAHATGVVADTATYSMPLGYGWTHNYNASLVFSGTVGGEPDTVIYQAPGGARLRFVDHHDGTYTPYPGIAGTLTLDASTYTLVAPTQETYVFDSAGRLIEQTDAKGNATTLSYDGSGRLQTVTEPTGNRSLAFEYYPSGRLRRVTDPLDRHVDYGYDTSGNLAVVTDTRGYTWTYTYGASVGAHLLTGVYDPYGNLLEGQTYDDQGRVIAQTDAEGQGLTIAYGNSGERTITDAAGNETIDHYNVQGTLVGQVSGVGGAPSYTYDGSYNRTWAVDELGRTTTYEWNDCGCAVETIVDSKGYTTTIDYDDLNNVRVITNALGYTTTFEYDGMDLKAVTDTMQHETRFTYNGYGQVTSVTVSETVTTDYQYDPLGQLDQITDAENNVTTMEYDPVGRLVTTTLAVGTAQAYRTVNTYDAGDNLLKVVVNHVDGVYNPDVPDEDLVTEYKYDAAGRLERITDPLGRVTVYEYDGAGRLVKTTENPLMPYGPYYQQQYNVITEYDYDDAGNPAWITDTLGNVTYYEYDELNRPFRVTENLSTTERADTNITTRFKYDAVGNVEWITDTLGRVTHNEYDELGRLITVTLNYTTAGGPYYLQQYNVTTTYTYNPLGWQTSVTDGRNETTTYEHDRLGQVTKIVDAEGGETDFAYNPLGLRTRIEDGADVTTRLDYDPLGRLERVWDELGNTTQYTYDALGNRTTMTDAEGVVTGYEYDTVGRLTAVVENYRQRFPSNHEQNVRTEYAYDGAGNLEKVTDARGYATTYAYDLLDRVTEITDPLSQITSYGYGLPLGSPTYRHEPGSVDTGYTYDHMGRTTYAQYQDRGVAYTYDKLGNLLSMAGTDGHHRTITLDALDRPLHVEEDLSTLEDTFDTLDGTKWVFNAYQSIEDGTIKNTGTGSDTSANFRRNAYTISEGEGIRVEFRVSQENPWAYFALENRQDGANYRWSLLADSSRLRMQTRNNDTWQYSADLINPIQTGAWYVVVLKVEEDGWLSAEVWQKDDPSVRGTYTGQLTDGLDWRFHHWIKSGTAWMDNYREFTYHAATTHTYDQVGNRTALTCADQTVTYAYDGVNRLASVTGWGSQVTYGYDGAGRVLTTTLPNGVVTTRIHDDAGRLTDIVHAGPSWGLAHYHYVLDGLGNRTQAVERVLPPTPVTHLPLVTRNYDGDGEMMSMPEGGPTAPETFQSPLPVTPLEPETFESPVQPVEPTTAPTPTPEASSRAPGKARLTGSVSGFAPLRWLGDVVRWLAEGLGKIWRALFPPGGAVQNAPLTFTSPIGGQGFGDEVTINYVYDDLYRLTDASYSTGQIFTYGYDAAGNRTSYSGPDGSHNYQYNEASQLTHTDGGRTHWYDGRGNLTNDGTRTYDWDGAGRLESVTQGGTTTAYTYAGDGVRLAKTVGGQQTTYVQDLVAGLPNVLAESTGSATTHYLYGLSQLAQVQDDQAQWLLGDGLGSVRQVADTLQGAVNGQAHIVLTRSYSPFGKLLGEDGDVATGFGFAGEQTDPNDLVFLRARYYDVHTGRFTSKDPFPGVASLPQTQHAYAYTTNNPVNLVDPSGYASPDQIEMLLRLLKFGTGGLKIVPDLFLLEQAFRVGGPVLGNTLMWGLFSFVADVLGALSGGVANLGSLFEAAQGSTELVGQFTVNDRVWKHTLRQLTKRIGASHPTTGGPLVTHMAQYAKVLGGALAVIQMAEGLFGWYKILTEVDPCPGGWSKAEKTIRTLRMVSASLKCASGLSGLLAVTTSWSVVTPAILSLISIATAVGAAGIDMYVEGKLSGIGVRPPGVLSGNAKPKKAFSLF